MNFLTNEWVLWAHLPYDNDWSVDSYKLIYKIQTLEDCISITESLPNIMIENCMLFLFKKGIFPTWEDPLNRNGGCFSFKIPNKNIEKVWKQLTYSITCNIVSNSNNFTNDINGLSVSPKKNFSIIKIWVTTNEKWLVNTKDLTEIKKHINKNLNLSKELQYLFKYEYIYKQNVPEY